MARGAAGPPGFYARAVSHRNANFDVPPTTLPNALGMGTNQLQPDLPFTAAAARSFGKLRSTVGTTVGLGTNRQTQFALRVMF